MKILEKCETCVFSRFCPTFGEWKCTYHSRRINPEVDCVDCVRYRPADGTKKKHQCDRCDLLFEKNEEERM